MNIEFQLFIHFQLTPDGKRINAAHSKPETNSLNENNSNVQKATAINSIAANKPNEEDFFDLLTRTQSKRMDDQRCSLKTIGHSQSQSGRESHRKPLVQQNSLPAISSTQTPAPSATKSNQNALLEMIADLQSERMDEQRAQLPGLVPSPQNLQQRRNMGAPINSQPTINNPRGSSTTTTRNEPAPDDAFLDMLMRCQGTRLEEQRSELPRPNVTQDVEQGELPNNNRRGCINANTTNAGATVPDEDFFSLIMRVQGGRMEDQRAAVCNFFLNLTAMPRRLRINDFFLRQVPFNTNRSNSNIRSPLNPGSTSNGVVPRKSK